jgi:hypothetical protein
LLFWNNSKTFLIRISFSLLSILNLLVLSFCFHNPLAAQKKIIENIRLLKPEKVTYLGTYRSSDGVIIPPTYKSGLDVSQTVLFDNTNSPGRTYFPGANVEALDWAALPSGGDVNQFEICYATEKTSGLIELEIKFYTGTNSSVNGNEIFSHTLNGLPV